ncbi:MAG: PqqD family protein [Acidobacteriota bacterium]
MAEPLIEDKAHRSLMASEDVIFRDLGGEAVLLHLASGEYYGLNETGSRMWSLLCELGDRARVLEVLQREYDAEPEDLAGELQSFVADLQAKNLIRSP